MGLRYWKSLRGVEEGNLRSRLWLEPSITGSFPPGHPSALRPRNGYTKPKCRPKTSHYSDLQPKAHELGEIYHSKDTATPHQALRKCPWNQFTSAASSPK